MAYTECSSDGAKPALICEAHGQGLASCLDVDGDEGSELTAKGVSREEEEVRAGAVWKPQYIFQEARAVAFQGMKLTWGVRGDAESILQACEYALLFHFQLLFHSGVSG